MLAKCWDIRSGLVFHLEDAGVPNLMTDNFEDVPFLYQADGQPEYLFIGIDEFGGAAILYDQLREIRFSMPNTAIVLVSREFTTNEFGTHRLQLADVSLRFPFNQSSLLLALIQAPINLRVWQQRLEELAV